MTDTVLTVTDVDISFRRTVVTVVLKECNLEVERGSVTALVGSNGAGNPVGQRGIAPGLSYLAQHKPLYPRLTVAEMLRFGRSTNDRWDDTYAHSLVEAAGISMSSRVR